MTNAAGSYIGAVLTMKKGTELIWPMFLFVPTLLFARLIMTMMG